MRSRSVDDLACGRNSHPIVLPSQLPMRQLWRKTSDIFWQFPILWLPTLVADVVTFCFERLWWLLRHEVIFRLMQSHSVLDNTPDYRIHGVAPTALTILLAFLKLFETFLGICFYTAAFLITALLVQGFLQNFSVEYSFVAAMLKQQRRNIFVFSLKLFLLLILAAALVTEAVIFLTPRLSHLPQLYGVTAADVVNISVILLLVCVAYIITPSAIALLRLPDLPPVKSNAVVAGRIFAMLAVAASSVVDVFAGPVERVLFREVAHINTVTSQTTYAIASLLGAFPYIFLFIALALIASRNTEDEDIQLAEPI